MKKARKECEATATWRAMFSDMPHLTHCANWNKSAVIKHVQKELRAANKPWTLEDAGRAWDTFRKPEKKIVFHDKPAGFWCGIKRADPLSILREYGNHIATAKAKIEALQAAAKAADDKLAFSKALIGVMLEAVEALQERAEIAPSERVLSLAGKRLESLR
jgi:hypothetical protein